MKKTPRDLTQGPVAGHILRMALPVLIGMSAQLMLSIIDGIYVGRLGRAESVAVLNYSVPVYYLLFAFFNGLSIGTSSVLSRYIGAQRGADANRTLGQIVWICLAILAVALLVYPLAIPRYLAFLKATPESAGMAHDFLSMIFLGMPLVILSLMLGGGLRAEGNMRALANSQLLAVVSNILVAPFFIFDHFHAFGLDLHGFGWGVRGGALASVTANALGTIYILRQYLGGKTRLRWMIWPGWKNLEGAKGIFKVGVPSSISQILIGVNWILMTRIAANFGEADVAAIGIGGRLDLLAVFPALAVMTAVLTMVGQNFGAGHHDRVRAAARAGVTTAVVLLASIGLVGFLCRHGLIGLFGQDAETHALAVHYFSWQCLGFALVGINIVCSGAFQGLGRGLPFLFLTTARLLGLTLPLAWLLSHRIGPLGMHYAPVIANAATAAVALLWLRSALRKLRPRDASSLPTA
ncbi:MAG TPA: MATE family efflux transporter [Fibrobacteria bacterium]|nr:MATE family efflux transporter [Fibrobacteria bacterium]